jgi:hypothetical protein
VKPPVELVGVAVTRALIIDPLRTPDADGDVTAVGEIPEQAARNAREKQISKTIEQIRNARVKRRSRRDHPKRNIDPRTEIARVSHRPPGFFTVGFSATDEETSAKTVSLNGWLGWPGSTETVVGLIVQAAPGGI